MNLQTWFAVPIWNAVLDLPDDQRRQAIDFCKEVKKRSVGRVLSNVGGWQSNDLLEADLLDSPLHFLLPIIKATCQKAVSDFGSLKKVNIENSWININKENTYNRLHNHAGGDLACVFYLTDNNSEIEFIRPYDIQQYYLDSLNSNYNTELSFTSVTYKPQKNTLLIFPSWLQHRVKINTDKTARISIAVNIKTIYEQIPNPV